MADSTNSSASPGASVTLGGATSRAYAIKRLQRQQAAQGRQGKPAIVKIPGVPKAKRLPGVS